MHDLSSIDALKNGGAVESFKFCLKKIIPFWQKRSTEPIQLIDASKQTFLDLKNLKLNFHDSKDLSQKYHLDFTTGTLNLNLRYYKLLKSPYLALKNPHEPIDAIIDTNLAIKLRFKKTIQSMLLNDIITRNFNPDKSLNSLTDASNKTISPISKAFVKKELALIQSDFFQGFYYGSTHNYDSFKKYEDDFYTHLEKIRQAEYVSVDLARKKTKTFIFGIHLAQQKDKNHTIDDLNTSLQKFILKHANDLGSVVCLENETSSSPCEETIENSYASVWEKTAMDCSKKTDIKLNLLINENLDLDDYESVINCQENYDNSYHLSYDYDTKFEMSPEKNMIIESLRKDPKANDQQLTQSGNYRSEYDLPTKLFTYNPSSHKIEKPIVHHADMINAHLSIAKRKLKKDLEIDCLKQENILDKTTLEVIYHVIEKSNSRVNTLGGINLEFGIESFEGKTLLGTPNGLIGLELAQKYKESMAHKKPSRVRFNNLRENKEEKMITADMYIYFE